MGIRIAWLVAGAVLAATLGAAPAPPSAPPADAVAVQQARAAVQRAVTMPYQKILSVQGVAAGSSDPVSKKIWVTAVNASAGPDAAEAGFRLAAISVNAAMPGAKVKATFDVQSLGDQVTLKLYAGDIHDPGPATYITTTVPTVGSNVQLVTNPFTLQPGKEYNVTVVALVRPDSTPDKPAHAVVKLTDLKWEF